MMEKRLLLLTESEAAFLESAIEAWTAVYTGDRQGFERHRSDRVDVKRKLAGKYTAAEIEEIGQAALGMMD